MARIIKPRKSNFSVVIIVDGKDEKWYLEKVRENYKPDTLRKTSLEPKLAQKKKVAELFEEAKDKVVNGFSKAILIIDFDELGQDNKELGKFKELFFIYQNVHEGIKKVSKKHQWMKQLMLIVNSPCIEFWYLLHFYKTQKYYPNFDSLKKDLTSIKELSEYRKSEAYYNKLPDIYTRLGGDVGLEKARHNAVAFDIEECKNKGFSEMNKLFDFFDKI